MVLGLALFTGFVLALRPTVPEPPLYAQWTPRLRALEPYGGEVLNARVGGRLVASGLIRRGEEVRAALLAGDPVSVTFTVGDPPPSLAPVLRLVDGEGREAFQLGVDGEDVVIRYRYRADDLRFSRPDLRVREALTGLRRGRAVEVFVRRDRRSGVEVTVDGMGLERTTVPVTRGWSLFRYRSGHPTVLRWVLDTLWMIALFAPLGYYAASPGRALALAAPLTLGFLWTPLLAGSVQASPVPLVLGLVALLGARLVPGSAATRCRTHPTR